MQAYGFCWYKEGPFGNEGDAVVIADDIMTARETLLKKFKKEKILDRIVGLCPAYPGPRWEKLAESTTRSKVVYFDNQDNQED